MLEQELHTTRENRRQAEIKLYDMVKGKQVPRSLVANPEGNPNYDSYEHLMESVENMQDLLDLANEELRNKSVVLEKVRLGSAI